MPGFKQVKFNNYDSVIDNINTNTAAILIEPIQGEGGIVPSDITFLKDIRKLCDEHVPGDDHRHQSVDS